MYKLGVVYESSRCSRFDSKAKATKCFTKEKTLYVKIDQIIYIQILQNKSIIKGEIRDMHG